MPLDKQLVAIIIYQWLCGIHCTFILSNNISNKHKICLKTRHDGCNFVFTSINSLHFFTRCEFSLSGSPSSACWLGWKPCCFQARPSHSGLQDCSDPTENGLKLILGNARDNYNSIQLTLLVTNGLFAGTIWAGAAWVNWLEPPRFRPNWSENIRAQGSIRERVSTRVFFPTEFRKFKPPR